MTVWDNYRKTIFVVNKLVKPPSSFAILTADNPGSNVLPKSVNKKATNALLQELHDLQCCPIEIRGSSRDLDYSECSYIAQISKQDALRIGERYQQNAIYWVDNNKLYLISCTAAQHDEEEYLGLFSERLMTP
jgi:hypothetical protein